MAKAACSTRAPRPIAGATRSMPSQRSRARTARSASPQRRPPLALGAGVAAGSTPGTIVLARPMDVGLAGLFPRARQVLGAAAVMLLGIAIGGLVLARRRDRARPSRG